MTKMSILIIDDNYEKIQSIADIFKSNDHVEIESENNSKAGLVKLKAKKYDMVIVDMIIPAVLGDMPSSSSGAQLIDMLISNRSYNFPNYLVAITSHKQEFEAYKGILFNKGVDLLLYDSSIGQVKNFIMNKMNFCLLNKNGYHEISQELNCPEKVTLRWLFNNVGLNIWALLITALLFSFSAGVLMADIDLVKKLTNKSPQAETTNVVDRP